MLALALGHRAAAAPAVAGALIGVYSIHVARKRPAELAHTFVVLDWALLGIALALSGGAESWLLARGAVPRARPAGRRACATSGRSSSGPSLLLVVILAIADPSLAGSRFLAGRQGRRAGRRRLRRRDAAASPPGGGARTAAARAQGRRQHRPLDGRLPAGVPRGRTRRRRSPSTGRSAWCTCGWSTSKTAATSSAPRAARSSSAASRGAPNGACGADGRAFSVRPDGLVLVLPGLSLAEARQAAADLAHDVSGNLIGGRRQTLATGASSFPTVRAHRGPPRGRPRRSPAGGGLHRGLRHRHPARPRLSSRAGRDDGPRLATPHAPR